MTTKFDAKLKLPIILTILAVLPMLLFPGDTPWIFDEPAEIAIALQANQNRKLASHALSGNFRIQYGPLPIQLNQLFLLISHDPRVLILLRATIVAALMAISLLWLGRGLNLPIYFAPVVLLAPSIWLWTRQPWAAFLVTPLSILSIAAYAWYLKSGCGWSLAITICAAFAIPLIHPQSIPLATVLLAHILIFQTKSLWRHKLKILPPLVILALLNYQYIKDTLQHISIPAALAQGHPSHTSRLAAFLGAFQSARLITPCAFESPLPTNTITTTAYWLAMLPIPLTILGLLIAIFSLRDPPSDNPVQQTRAKLYPLLLSFFLVHALFAAATRLPPSPHYQFGLFGPTILAIWLALDRIPHCYLVRTTLVSIYALALAVFTLGSMCIVHLHGWPRDKLGPTLNEQIELVEKLNHFPNTTAYTTVPIYMMDSPHAILALRLLNPAPPRVETHPPPVLLITFSSDGRLQLIELPSFSPQPPNSKLIPLDYSTTLQASP